MGSRMRSLDTRKKRKRRGIKQDGTRSIDMCPHCYSFNCDPMCMSPRFSAKVDRRRAQGVCVSCGHKPCRCKSKY